MPKTCFIIGPIGEREDEIRVHADKVLKYIIQPCEMLKKLDYGDPIRADKLPDPGRITPQIVEKLKTADLVIADLTFGNPNVYYELSLRHALGKRAIHICHEGTRPSFDIVDNRTIFFTFDIARVEAAREELERQITRTNEQDYKVRNPIVDTISFIQLEQSAKPVEQHLAQLGRDMEQLNLEMQTIKTNLNLLAQGYAAGPVGSHVTPYGGRTFDAFGTLAPGAGTPGLGSPAALLASIGLGSRTTNTPPVEGSTGLGGGFAEDRPKPKE
jgi:hypothetical protein